MQVCNSLQTDNHASTPPLSFFTGWMPSCRLTNSVKALLLLILIICAVLSWHRCSGVTGGMGQMGSIAPGYSKQGVQNGLTKGVVWLPNSRVNTHHLMAVCPRLPGWALTRKVKPIWIRLWIGLDWLMAVHRCSFCHRWSARKVSAVSTK